MLLVNNVQPEKYAQFLSSQIHKSYFNQGDSSKFSNRVKLVG